MNPIGLSILVVSCKDYKPSHDWYLCKSGGYITGTVRIPGSLGYDEERHNEFNASEDFVLMPECHGMPDEEAAEVAKAWCEQNTIPYIDDLNELNAVHRWYYRYDD